MKNIKENNRLAIVWLGLVLMLVTATSSIAIADDKQTPQVAGSGVAEENKAEATGERDNASEEKTSFDIVEFNVVGNTLLPTTTIEQTVYSFLGEKKTIDDAEAARTALEKAYHDAGYLTVLVNIPEQKVDAGVVKLAVQETTVDRIRVTGAHYFTLGEIKEVVPELEEGKTPHFPTVQKQLAALNRTQDRRVTPVLKAGKTPGTVQVELRVDDKLPLHGTLAINDRYSADTSRLRTSASIKYDNLWQLQHSLSASVTLSPENVDQVQVYSGTYAIPLKSGDYLAMYGVKSNTNVAAVGTLNVIGSGVILGARYIHPLPNLENFYHTFTFGVDYKDFEQTIALNEGSFERPIAYMPFVMSWDGVWNTPSSTTKLGINFNANARGLVGDGDAQFALKRSSAKSNYAYVRSNFEYDWHLKNGMRFDFRLAGQLADQPLISNEQFAIGGLDTVRGYLESEVLGDKGYSASAEVHSPSWAKYVSSKVTDLHVLGFVDVAEETVLEPQSTQTARRDLASVGAGLRLVAGRWNFKLDVAEPLKAGADTRTKAGDTRAHVALDYAF